MALGEGRLYENLMELEAGINACCASHAQMPALILLYASIDVCAWLACDSQNTTKAAFLDWVDRYLLPHSAGLECTALELYGARCGLLHTLTPESQLSAAGSARQIGYAWGDATAEALRRARTAIQGEGEYVGVHFNDLHEAWRQGVAAFLEELEADRDRKARALAKAAKFFARPPRELMESVLEPPT